MSRLGDGLPIRYVIFAVMPLCTTFFVWEFYGSPKLRRAVQKGLFLGMCLLLPFNMMAGFEMFGNWYGGVMAAVERDIAAGTPRLLLAQRHRDSLIHWWDEPRLAAHMQMLHEDKVGPFAQIQADPVNIQDFTSNEPVPSPKIP